VDTSGASVVARPASLEAETPADPERAPIRIPLKVKLSLLITALVVLNVALVGLFLLRQLQQSLSAEMS
jgi:hypothetical protein